MDKQHRHSNQVKDRHLLFVGPYPPIYGGYATIIYNLSDFLLKKGFKITVLSFENTDKIEFPKSGLEVLRVNRKKNVDVLFSHLGNIRFFFSLYSNKLRLRQIISTIISCRIVKKIIREKNVGTVVTFNLFDSLFGFHLKKELGAKVTLFTMVFGEIVQGISTDQRYRRFLKSILEASNEVISSSKYCAGLYNAIGYNAERIKVIYVGVNIEEFSPEGKEVDDLDGLQISPDDMVILFVGRFLKDMGLDVVLECIPSVLNNTDKVSFLLAGANGELDEEASALQAEWPTKVFIHYNFPSEVLPRYYQRCSIVLAPTKALRACMGISIKEAMSFGKPVIVSDSGGIAEAVLNNKTGIVIPLKGRERISPPELEQAIYTLISDQNLLRKMRRAARQRALELFDSHSEAQQWLELINKYAG